MKFRKLTSLVLSLSLLLSLLTVYSSGLDEKPDGIEEYSSEGVYIICEENEKRSEFEKHFITSDSKFIAVSYPEQIHYVDENGNFQNIDCSLKSKDGVLSSNVGSYAASFPTKLNDDSQLSIVDGKNHFSWCLSAVTSDGNVIGYSCSAAEVIENEIDKKDCLYINDPSSFELPNLSSTVRYRNVFEGTFGVDAVYTVSYNKVKEDIVFNERSDISSLALNVQTEYIAVVNENGSVDFINENGEYEYTVGIPYLYDAKDNVCSNVSVSAEQTGNGYIIKYVPDKNWLDSEERAYPVVFDPSITTREYSSNIVDTYVRQGTTDDHSSETRIYVGLTSGNSINRTFIKINNLPDIDPNCPILSATLTLKIYATTTTGKAVSLYKVNSSWNTATLTYANQPSATPLSTCAFDASNLYYNLNLTTDFPYLYDEYNSVSNYGYMVRYTDESNTNPDWNSMYSMEYTSNTSYRPIFTVVYGYSLPDELVSGGIYSFQNAGSMSLMTVHNGTNANDTNVYQLSSNGPQNATVSQKFKLEEVSSTGGYYLRAMCSSNGAGKVLDIYKTNGFVENGNNVQIYTANDPLAQHWLLVPVDSVFFKIIPRTNMSLALTAYGNSDGTANGKTSTSAGNIFVSEYTGSDYQKWFIYDCVNNIGISAGTGSVSNNTYYFNNSYTGKYLHKNTNYSANSSSGLVSNLGNTIRWKVTYHSDNLYTIQSSSNLSLYLNHTTSNTVSLLDCSGYSNIPNTCLWRINTNAISYVSSSNSSTYYLSNSGTTLSLVTSRGSSGSDSYKKTTWRFCTVDYYSGRELNSNFSISDMVLDVGESKTPIINKSPSNALWANVSDFIFTIQAELGYSGDVIVDDINEKIRGFTAGKTYIKATSKVTNLHYYFVADVQPLLEKEADYSLPLNIIDNLKLIRTSISQVETSNLSLSEKEIMVNELELQEDLIRADYIITGGNYQGSYAQSVINNFNSIIDDDIETVSDDIYRVVANRMLVLFAHKWSEIEYNSLAFFLDDDCCYNEWNEDSQAALNWYYLSTEDGNDFFNRADSGITPAERTVTLISNLQKYKYYHDMVKNFVAINVGGMTEVTVDYGNGNHGRADIAKSYASGTYFWEVKPNNPKYYNDGIGTKQLKNYVVKGNLYNSVHKGNYNFSPIYSAGMPINQFNLLIPDLSSSGDNVCLEVTPSQYYSSVQYESGLILYKEVDNPNYQTQTYYSYETQLELINESAQVALPSTNNVGVEDLIYTMAFAVIEGVTLGIIITFAPSFATCVSEMIAGTSTTSTIIALQQGIECGSIVISPLSIYSLTAISNLAA